MAGNVLVTWYAPIFSVLHWDCSFHGSFWPVTLFLCLNLKSDWPVAATEKMDQSPRCDNLWRGGTPIHGPKIRTLTLTLTQNLPEKYLETCQS